MAVGLFIAIVDNDPTSHGARPKFANGESERLIPKANASFAVTGSASATGSVPGFFCGSAFFFMRESPENDLGGGKDFESSDESDNRLRLEGRSVAPSGSFCVDGLGVSRSEAEPVLPSTDDAIPVSTTFRGPDRCWAMERSEIFSVNGRQNPAMAVRAV